LARLNVVNKDVGALARFSPTAARIRVICHQVARRRDERDESTVIADIRWPVVAFVVSQVSSAVDANHDREWRVILA
jgi:hypothetical protein